MVLCSMAFLTTTTSPLAIQNGNRNIFKNKSLSGYFSRSSQPRKISVSPCMTMASWLPLLPINVPVTEHFIPVTNWIAASESDFGGYTGPIIGLLTIFALIVFLSPPLKE
ncbi:hypothetical protein GAYE_SCF12G3353 [Galdieria yellowstonensis]|uniref:Uncharacterized protein n=1 Tax=Galdieria yellowstonensis TaxID=3028027 RepID=A0AAV9IDD7_9RHOD|nr:hypothetical protein GAYE_SCF12G3353 [Galdieria yellowstonensis]